MEEVMAELPSQLKASLSDDDNGGMGEDCDPALSANESDLEASKRTKGKEATKKNEFKVPGRFLTLGEFFSPGSL